MSPSRRHHEPSDRSLLARTTWQGIASRLVLFGVLVQILLFFVGLMVPVQRAASLWGKDLEERRGVVWQPGRALKAVAEQFPTNARMYLLYPQSILHACSVYYFYPRTVSITMANRRYNTGEEYASWNEIPSWQWLVSNKFDFVISFKDGARAWQVRPGLSFDANPQ